MPERDGAELEQVVARRAFWRGTLSFGLVSIPVNLLSADRPNRPALRMVDREGHPLGRRYYRARDDRPLTSDELVRGYEVEKNRFVVLTDEDLERVAPEQTREIDLRLFVPADRIDPMLFERGYYLLPGATSTTAYRLLARALEETGRAGIATFVMRTKEYLVAILAEAGILRAETLRFADEIRSPAALDLPEPRKPPAATVRRARKEIERLTRASLATGELVDESVERLRRLAERKARAHEDVVEVAAQEEDEEEAQPSVPDLFSLLRRSVRGRSEQAQPASAVAAAGRGHAKRARASGTAQRDLAGQSKAALYEEAKRLDIPGRSAMSKSELVRAIRGARAA